MGGVVGALVRDEALLELKWTKSVVEERISQARPQAMPQAKRLMYA